MTGAPMLAATFTDKWAEEYNRLRSTVQAAMTASRAHVRYAKIVAAAIDVTSATGHRIVLNPAGDDKPAIWLIPANGGGNVSKIRSLDDVNTGEAVLSITSGQNAAGNASAELQLGSGSVRMQIHDADGSGDNGGFADWNQSYAKFGFLNGSDDNYFQFSSNQVSRHFGQWDDFGSLPSNAGLLWGSITIGGSGTSATISYPASMDSNMGPIVSLRSGAGSAMAWCITASNTSYFEVRWATATSVALYMCSFRH